MLRNNLYLRSVDLILFGYLTNLNPFCVTYFKQIHTFSASLPANVLCGKAQSTGPNANQDHVPLLLQLSYERR